MLFEAKDEENKMNIIYQQPLLVGGKSSLLHFMQRLKCDKCGETLFLVVRFLFSFTCEGGFEQS